MKAIGKALFFFLAYGDMQYIRATIGALSMWWAYNLFRYPDEYTTRQAYELLDDRLHIHPYVVAVLFAAVGITMFSRALGRVPLSKSWYACIVALVSCIVWTTVAVGVQFGKTPPPLNNGANLGIAFWTQILLIRCMAKLD